MAIATVKAISEQEKYTQNAAWSIIGLSGALALVLQFIDQFEAVLGVELAWYIFLGLFFVVGLASVALLPYLIWVRKSFRILPIVALIIGIGLTGTVGFILWEGYLFARNCYDCFF